MQITASKKVINAWAMYDWANSVYNLVITATFFPIYFIGVTKAVDGSNTVRFLGMSFINSSLYDYAISFAYMLIALSYPILTSIADSRGNKKNFMRFFCYMGALGCSSLYFFTGSQNLWLGLLAFVMSAMGYVGSLVFYNAFLPEIAAPQDRDRISAKGFSMGYIGSVILQLIGFGLVLYFESKGDKTSGVRITFLLVGIWWFGFAQITFAGLPKSTKVTVIEKTNVITAGFTRIKNVWQHTRQLPALKLFLRAFFFYSMGVQSVMLAATLFGSQTLGLPKANLIITIVIIQLVAIAGAYCMSSLSARYGNLQVLVCVLILWVIICCAAFLTAEVKERGENPEIAFYGIAVAVGLVMGGVQSLSRSTFAKLMPETRDTASYFSYYDFTEKIAIVIGIFSFGFIHELAGNMKYSVLSLIVFFVIGLSFLLVLLRKRKIPALKTGI